jgi:glycosyltransferase involved in cell wall biosynthesis
LLAVCAAGLCYALIPIDGRGRNAWLPGKWAEWLDMHDWWLNFWAFAVLGMVIFRLTGRERKAWMRLLAAVALGTLLAAGIEVAQFRIPGRRPDPADLTAAFAGSATGACLAAWFRARRAGERRGGPLRVCFLDQTGQLGGAELMLLDLVAGAPGEGLGPGGRELEVEVILFEDGPFREALQSRGVACRVERLGGMAAIQTKRAQWIQLALAGPEVFGLARRLAHRIRELDADLVYSNTAKALLVGVIAARWSGRPLVHHLHDLLSPAHFSRGTRGLLVAAANLGASAVIANSSATAAAFLAGGGRKGLVTIIPNGFDPGRFEKPLPERVVRCRAECSGPQAMPGVRFGVFGRLAPWKGQMEFLEALAMLPDARGVIVGEALFTEEDRAYAEALRQRAEAGDLRDRVFFAGFREDVVSWMHAVDVVVHCSTQPEPFGRVIVEAQLCGVPVIATRGGGVPDIVDDGITGKLVTPGDPLALAEAMRFLAESPATRDFLARQGRETARQRFGLAEVRRRTEAVITVASGLPEER